MTLAIFPGTFDPPHLGHLDVLEQAARTFTDVIVAIMENPAKSPHFPVGDRIMLMHNTVTPAFSNVHVQLHGGLLVEAAAAVHATHIVRSLRMGLDFDYEYPMTLVNRQLAPELITVYFPAKQEHFHISSTLIRQLIHFGHDVSPFVPESVAAFVAFGHRKRGLTHG